MSEHFDRKTAFDRVFAVMAARDVSGRTSEIMLLVDQLVDLTVATWDEAYAAGRQDGYQDGHIDTIASLDEGVIELDADSPASTGSAFDQLEVGIAYTMTWFETPDSSTVYHDVTGTVERVGAGADWATAYVVLRTATGRVTLYRGQLTGIKRA